MQNIGEEIVGNYLQYIEGCEFIQYNLYTPNTQGEIDVVGINLKSKTVFVCEVAIHLITGIQYVKNKRPDTYNRFMKKFNKDIDYAEKYFANYKNKRYMLWSPIVKQSKKDSKYNQLNMLNNVKNDIMKSRNVKIELIINDEFMTCLTKLRTFSSKITEELKSPVLRLMQIEERLKRKLKIQ